MDALIAKYQPLYLKYRPQSLAELVGQKSVAQTLSNAIEHNRLTHAYLFTGPRGCGKTSTARILAKSLNCEKGPTATPCGNCTQCREIKEGNSPAVFELDAASNNSVDDARVLIERAPLVAVGGRFKFYIIDECHMLTKEAFNALLKTIEEPPANVVFVLATTEEHKVPQTIVSRCQKLMFRLVASEELSEYLAKIAKQENIAIEPEVLALIARRSGGGLRDALGLLDQASLIGEPGKPVSVKDLLNLLGAVHEDVLLEISQYIFEKQGQLVLASLNKLLLDGREPAVVAQELSNHFLNLVKASYAGEQAQAEKHISALGSANYLEGLCKQAPQWDRTELAQIVEQLNRLEATCRRTTQPITQLEMGMLSVCHRHDIGLVRQLRERLDQLELQLAGGIPDVPQIQPRPHTPPAQPASTLQASPAPLPVAPPSIQPVSPPAPPPVAHAPASIEPPTPPAPPPVAPATTPVENEASPAGVGAQHAVPGSQAQAISQPAKATETPVGAQANPVPTESNSPPQRPEDLDYIWDQILEYLDKHHKPAHSLLSVHGCCLALTQKVITIGLFSPNLQKSIENKVPQIKAAAEAILQRPLEVRVTVASGKQPKAATMSSPRSDGPAPTRSSSTQDDRPAENAQSDRPIAGSGGRNLSGGSGGTQAENFNNGNITASSQSSYITGGLQGPNVVAQNVGNSGYQAPPAPKGPVGRNNSDANSERTTGGTMSKPSPEHDAQSSSTVKEAYKLFDGPGSRFIS